MPPRRNDKTELVVIGMLNAFSGFILGRIVYLAYKN